MNEDLDKIFELASQGNFTEARQYIQDMDVSDSEKAHLNAMVWNVQNKKITSSPSQPEIPKFPVISMILGFVLICAAFFFSGNVQSGMVITGLVMAGVIPTIYCLKEKYQNDKAFDVRKVIAGKYTDGEADINFPWQVPSPAVIVTTIIGIVLMLAAIGFYGNAGDNSFLIAAAVLAAAGFVVMAVSRILACSYSGALMWTVIAVSSLFIFLAVAAAYLSDEAINVSRIFIATAGLLLMLYPLLYKYIMKRLCPEEIEAKCVDVQIIQGRRSYELRYRGIWKYEYNGVTYIHREKSSPKCPDCNEIRTIRIAPRSPHNIYMGNIPASSLLFFAAGFFILVFFLILLIPLASEI